MAEWKAYDEMYGFGHIQDDIRMADLYCLIYNVNRHKNGSSLRRRDAIKMWQPDANKIMTEQEFNAVFDRLFKPGG